MRDPGQTVRCLLGIVNKDKIQGERCRMQIMCVDGGGQETHSGGEKSRIQGTANLWAKINLSSLRCSCRVFCYNSK